MPAIGIYRDGDHAKFGEKVGVNRLPMIHTTDDWEIDILEHGMVGGRSSLMLAVNTNYDGQDILLMLETSVNAWMMASHVIAVTCRDEIEQPGWARMSEATRNVLIPRYAEVLMRVTKMNVEDAMKAAGMMLDVLGADAPPK